MTTSEINQMLDEIVVEVLSETASDFANMAEPILCKDETEMLSYYEVLSRAVAMCNQYIPRVSAAITVRLLTRLGVISPSPE